MKRGRAGKLTVVALTAALLGLAIAAPAAPGAFGIQKWEAGTCTQPDCDYASSPDSDFYAQNAGHPQYGITDFTVNTDGLGAPEGAVRDVRVDLPPGLSVNPEATPQCTEAELESVGGPAKCLAKGAKVGTVEVFANTLFELPITADVFNIVPRAGLPAQFGFTVNLVAINPTVYLEGTVNWESDYHQGFTIRTVPDDVPLARNRLIFDGRAGDGTFLTLPSGCNGPTTTGLTVDSHSAPGSFLHYATTPAGPGRPVPLGGCAAAPKSPSSPRWRSIPGRR